MTISLSIFYTCPSYLNVNQFLLILFILSCARFQYEWMKESIYFLHIKPKTFFFLPQIIGEQTEPPSSLIVNRLPILEGIMADFKAAWYFPTWSSGPVMLFHTASRGILWHQISRFFSDSSGILTYLSSYINIYIIYVWRHGENLSCGEIVIF